MPNPLFSPFKEHSHALFSGVLTVSYRHLGREWSVASWQMLLLTLFCYQLSVFHGRDAFPNLIRIATVSLPSSFDSYFQWHLIALSSVSLITPSLLLRDFPSLVSFIPQLVSVLKAELHGLLLFCSC